MHMSTPLDSASTTDLAQEVVGPPHSLHGVELLYRINPSLVITHLPIGGGSCIWSWTGAGSLLWGQVVAKRLIRLCIDDRFSGSQCSCWWCPAAASQPSTAVSPA